MKKTITRRGLPERGGNWSIRNCTVALSLNFCHRAGNRRYIYPQKLSTASHGNTRKP